MRIERDVDDELLRRLLHVTNQTSVAVAIRQVLSNYINAETADSILQLAGKIEFDPGYLAERERHHPGTTVSKDE